MRKIGGELNLSAELSDFEIINYLNHFDKFFSTERKFSFEMEMLNSKIKIYTSSINHYHNNLKEFADKNNIKDLAPHERSLESLLGLGPSYLYEANLENWLVFAYFRELDEQEAFELEKYEEDDWAPPENFAYGTDDEKEIYEDFLKRKNKKD